MALDILEFTMHPMKHFFKICIYFVSHSQIKCSFVKLPQLNEEWICFSSNKATLDRFNKV